MDRESASENLLQRGSSVTRREELANSLSHGLGFVAAVAAVPILVVAAARRGDAAGIVGATVFAATLLVLYFASTVYHALPESPAKRRFKAFDHAAIYLLIAGTYTPFTLGALRGGWGWTLFGIIWGLALGGVLIKTLAGARGSALSTWIYLGMGWMAIIAIKPIWEQVPRIGLVWMLAGGLAYTVGVLFYTARGRRYSHLAWHLFVMAGSACHFVAVWRYSA